MLMSSGVSIFRVKKVRKIPLIFRQLIFDKEEYLVIILG